MTQDVTLNLDTKNALAILNLAKWPSKGTFMRDRLVALSDSDGGRAFIAAGYLLGGVMVALFFPQTPDELSRISHVRALLEGDAYQFYWPAGNMLMILFNPIINLELIDDLRAVRLFNLLISSIPIVVLIYRCQAPTLLPVATLLFPYTWLVTATASQQGLMLPLLILIAWGVAARNLWTLFAASAGLYLVNPAMLIVIPGALFFLVLAGRGSITDVIVVTASYLPMALLVLLAWRLTGDVMPTLSSNGARNLWLGNNPNPLAHRGVATEVPSSGYLSATWDFLRERPGAAAHNFSQKLALYWAPWDYLRSGMGSEVQPFIFSYIAAAQLVIYITAFRMRNAANTEALLVALSIGIAAWLIYSFFFVKVRFRAPFDLLLFASCMVPSAPRR